MDENGCLICKLNRSGKYRIYADSFWVVDIPFDINLDGLLFLKSKRHVESLDELNKKERNSLGEVLAEFCKLSKKIASTNKVITMNLGFKDPHLHFWIVPVTNSNREYVKKISLAVKRMADGFTNRHT
ncbi:MAG: HIT family protein [Patescibacteria group bacterium]|jgi:diadenosine tetraphosphate (Ap4A) HIT family hydrolase